MDMVCKSLSVRLPKLRNICDSPVTLLMFEKIVRSASPGVISEVPTVKLMVALINRHRRISLSSLEQCVSLATSVRKFIFNKSNRDHSSSLYISSSTSSSSSSSRIMSVCLNALTEWQSNGGQVTVNPRLSLDERVRARTKAVWLSTELLSNVSAILTSQCSTTVGLLAVMAAETAAARIQTMGGMYGVRSVALGLLGSAQTVCDWRTLARVWGMAWSLFASRHRCPVSPTCGNWVCCNTWKDTESSVVTKLCSGCRRVRYCGLICQEHAWKNGHKMDCGKGVK